MRYFVTLNGREFPLRLERNAPAARLLAAAEPAGTAERELGVELLRPARHGRPALVRVDGKLLRVLRDGAGAAAGNTAGANTAARPGSGRVRVNGHALRVELETELARRVRPAASAARASGMRVSAPMPGRVVKVNVRPGDSVAAGAALLSVEAMKMENELQAPGAGRVVSVSVQVGATVESDQELVVIAPEP
ncbi:MAG TPA: acetyl-CoA carboxylase biotin carboxyl carrier protein subunit [Polyangiaceae bacterium]|nr:acetyl-CoA carboxylase biotin carboxyl carrier protein subunit [Polyangiaceae bacterium]